MPRSNIEPRLLTKEQAASYCGVSTPIFSDKCPVQPVAIGDGERLKRWDRADLDAWIDTLCKRVEHAEVDWITRVVEGSNGSRARQGA